MTERAARSGPAGLASRVGSVLRGAWHRVLHLWRASLGFRVVIVTMLLGILVLTAVGTYLYGSIAQGLVDSRQRIAAEDSLRDATDAQGQFDSTDQTDTQDKLTQFATTLIKSYRRDAGNETRYVVLTRFDDNRSPFIVGPIESGSVGVRFIPDELRQQVAAQPDRQHLQVATIDEGGDTISAVIVGQTVVLPVAGNYGLYFIYPVALVGAFMVFPLLGFSINTLSLFGLVLAIGLVVDDAIVVVEAVEQHIERGLSPRDAALKAMEEVSGPVVAIALIMAVVFIPTAFIPGITGRMYQQFAVTIAVSVLISAFNALTLSPALSALLLRPRREMRGPLGWFFRGFNRVFERVMGGYLHGSRPDPQGRLRHTPAARRGGRVGPHRHPASRWFRPDGGPGLHLRQRPASAGRLARPHRGGQRQARRDLQDAAGHQVLHGRGGLQPAEPGHDDLQLVLLPHAGRLGRPHKHGLTADVIIQQLNKKLAGVAEAQAFAFSPPAIPGIGTSGGVTFMLEDRAGKDPAFLAEQTDSSSAAARKRPEFAAALHDPAAERAAVLRRGGSRQGAEARHPPDRGVPGAAGVPRRRLRELLQPVRASLAGVRPGRRPVPDQADKSVASTCATPRAIRCRCRRWSG